MPIGGFHHCGSINDETIRHIPMKQVAHRVDEHHPRGAPPQWLLELLWNQPQIESLLVRMPWATTESLSECFRIAADAAGANLRATADGIPRRVGPFDCRAVTHFDFRLLFTDGMIRAIRTISMVFGS